MGFLEKKWQKIVRLSSWHGYTIEETKNRDPRKYFENMSGMVSETLGNLCLGKLALGIALAYPGVTTFDFAYMIGVTGI